MMGLSLLAIAIVSVVLLSLRECALKRFGQKPNINIPVKAAVAWILVGVAILLVMEKIVG